MRVITDLQTALRSSTAKLSGYRTINQGPQPSAQDIDCACTQKTVGFYSVRIHDSCCGKSVHETTPGSKPLGFSTRESMTHDYRYGKCAPGHDYTLIEENGSLTMTLKGPDIREGDFILCNPEWSSLATYRIDRIWSPSDQSMGFNADVSWVSSDAVLEGAAP